MRSPFPATVLLLLAVACASAPDPAPSVPSGRRIGEPVEARDVLPYATVAASPADHADRTLLVSAKATAVCQRAGCWMQIEDGGRTAMVRWETGCGGKYAFPTDAAGRRVLVQGSFYPVELSPDDLEHLREEAGEDVDIPARGWELNASAVVLLDEPAG